MSTYYGDICHWESISLAANPDDWLYYDACIDTSLVLRFWDEDSSDRLETNTLGLEGRR